jgi:uncharacterized oligopeptide transporter (OPT) family protein
MMNIHFKLDEVPPVSRTFAAVIKAGSDPAIIRPLMTAALFGAALQFIGGTKRSIGILFATGLLINNPIYGCGLLVALVIRKILEKKYKNWLDIWGGGFIAGDGLFGFFSAIIRMVAL